MKYCRTSRWSFINPRNFHVSHGLMHDEENQSKLKVHSFFPTEHPIDKLSAFSTKIIARLRIPMFRAKLVYYKLVPIATCHSV